MENEDLHRIAVLIRDLPPAPEGAMACDLLLRSDGPLWRADVWRLLRSAECAFHARQMERAVFTVLRHLCEELRDAPDNARFVGLDHAHAWRDALAVARTNAKWLFTDGGDKSRQQVVGETCARLTKRGRKLRVKAYGPDWDETSLRNACRSIDHLVSRLGGRAVLNQCAGAIEAMDRTFEDIWLLGDRNLGMGQAKEPAVPFGWLIGLAAKHMHRPNTCRNPSTAWRSLVTQAWDVAASFDCQRYNYFENIVGISPAQIDETMSEAIGWRALFFTPQAPRLLLPRLRAAFEQEVPKNRYHGTHELILALFREMIDLAGHLRSIGCTEIRRNDALRAYPNLYVHARAPKGSVNRNYLVPVRGVAREDTRIVLFDGPQDILVIRPIAMAVHAFCEVVFGLVHKRLGNAAAKIIGDVIEATVADACEGKADLVWRGQIYGPKSKRLEIDVAARTGDRVTLIETKAKNLTREGQVGTSGQFYADYARSFLPMVRQLARHDHHLRSGRTPIATREEVVPLEVERVAVSPVSFGPIGDGPTTTALMSALPGVRIHPLRRDDQTAHKSVEVFNEAVSKLMEELAQAIPKDANRRHDLFDFFLFTHWVDLGQLLVALDYADRVDQALQPIRHLTTGSRDFWTEFAIARAIRPS